MRYLINGTLAVLLSLSFAKFAVAAMSFAQIAKNYADEYHLEEPSGDAERHNMWTLILTLKRYQHLEPRDAEVCMLHSDSKLWRGGEHHAYDIVVLITKGTVLDPHLLVREGWHPRLKQEYFEMLQAHVKDLTVNCVNAEAYLEAMEAAEAAVTPDESLLKTLLWKLSPRAQ